MLAFPKDSNLEKFAIICRIELEGINARKFVAARTLFLSDAHVPVAIVVAFKAPYYVQRTLGIYTPQALEIKAALAEDPMIFSRKENRLRESFSIRAYYKITFRIGRRQCKSRIGSCQTKHYANCAGSSLASKVINVWLSV